MKKSVSVVIPAYNEELSIGEVVRQTGKFLGQAGIDYEIIVVENGSTDSTQARALAALKEVHGRLIRLRQADKSKALQAGFRESKGRFVIMMDADMQHSPADIPRFLGMLERFDVVNGWRRTRRDPLTKKLPSILFNKASNLLFGLGVHDANCGFKAFRREVVGDLKLKTGDHRYLVALLKRKGYSVGEIEVAHFPRRTGQSKYGGTRMLWGMMDLLGLAITQKLSETPFRMFGLLGLLLSGIGCIIGGYVFANKLLFQEQITPHLPLVLLGLTLVLGGLQFLSFGVIMEALNGLKQE